MKNKKKWHFYNTKMRQEGVVSFRERWSLEGTHYTQGVTIYQSKFDLLSKKIRETKDSDHLTDMYLHKMLDVCGKIVFLNLTQRDFFTNNLQLKRKLLDRNTYLIIL